MQTQHGFDAPNALLLDGLLGQEDELDDTEEGIDEPISGDISSGASNRTRKVEKPGASETESEEEKRKHVEDMFHRTVRD